jgi:hypothetical protein
MGELRRHVRGNATPPGSGRPRARPYRATAVARSTDERAGENQRQRRRTRRPNVQRYLQDAGFVTVRIQHQKEEVFSSIRRAAGQSLPVLPWPSLSYRRTHPGMLLYLPGFQSGMPTDPMASIRSAVLSATLTFEPQPADHFVFPRVPAIQRLAPRIGPPLELDAQYIRYRIDGDGLVHPLPAIAGARICREKSPRRRRRSAGRTSYQ